MLILSRSTLRQWELVTSTIQIGSAATQTTTSPIDTTDADLIVVFAACSNLGISQISDSYNSSVGWIAGPALFGGGGGGVQIVSYYCQTGLVGPNHTFTVQGLPGSTNIPVAVLAFSELQSTVTLDQTSSGTTQPTPIIPSKDNALILTAVAARIAGVPNVGGGFRMTGAQPLAGGATYGLGAAYFTQRIAFSISPAWTPATQPTVLLSFVN